MVCVCIIKRFWTDTEFKNCFFNMWDNHIAHTCEVTLGAITKSQNFISVTQYKLLLHYKQLLSCEHIINSSVHLTSVQWAHPALKYLDPEVTHYFCSHFPTKTVTWHHLDTGVYKVKSLPRELGKYISIYSFSFLT